MTEPLSEHMLAAESEARFESQHRRFRVTEFYIWVLIASVCMGRVLIAALDGAPSQYIFRNYYGDLLLSFFVVMFPILFLLVFGSLPLEALRRRRLSYVFFTSAARVSTDRPPETAHATEQRTSSRTEPNAATRGDGASVSDRASTADALVSTLAQSSKKLADGIYGRSGVYLLVGVMVAFSGLAFFYLQTSSTFNTNDLTSLLVSLAPKFGILFFIEFVAFFFLKQYRTSMDEFRYYEAIKRHREEILVLLRVGHEQGRPTDTFELVKLGQFFSVAGRLQKEESTELLEARKLEKNETAVLEKAIDAIAQVRK